MWYGIGFKTPEELQAAIKTVMRQKIKAIEYPIFLPSAPGRLLPGLAFPEESREELLRALGLEDGPTTATGDTRLRLILTDEVTVVCQPGDREAAVENVLRIYAPYFGRHLLATDPHGNSMPPVEEPGVFHIRFYSTPVKAQTGQAFAKIFGLALPPGIKDGLPPSGLGIPLRAPEGVVAELIGENLYILFDLPHNTPDIGLPYHLLAKILEMALEVRAGVSGGGQGGAGAEENDYVRFALRRHRVRAVAQLAKRESLAEKIRGAKEVIARAREELSFVENELAHLRTEREDVERAARAEYQQLIKLPHVMRVEIKNNYLSIFTDDIFLQHEARTYRLGRYQIKIPLEGGMALGILSQAPKRLGNEIIHHPHIIGVDGTQMCLGNYSPVIQLIAEHQWALVGQLMIEFLHHVNAAHPHYVQRLQSCWTPLPKPRPCTCGKM